ncbi:MAG: lysophospholipid acyltransferase family protein [Chloroflexota bacterium]
MAWFYWLASTAMDLATRLICDRHVIGRENVPTEGPLLLVSNHLSLIDPPLLGAVFPRPIRFMAKEELFRVPFVKWIAKGYRAFPVRRGEADRQAFQTTLRLLRQGEVIGIFPEGTRSRGGGLRAAHPGAALIALRAGVPVVPVGIVGSEQVLHWPRRALRPRLEVHIGKPFTLASGQPGAAREALAGQTEALMCAIAALVPPGYRGIYDRGGVDTQGLR